MKKLKITSILSTGLLAACLPPSHHFSGAEILKPGVHRNSLGVSYPDKYYNYQTLVTDTFQLDATGKPRTHWEFCNNTKEKCINKPTQNINFSYRWRNGAMDSLWIFPGLEYGFELQTPLSMEFGIGLGLPSPSPSLKHSLGLGWALGAWADNSWWSEYSIGNAQSNTWHFYFSQRITYMATTKGDVNVARGDFADHFQTWKFLSALGLNYTLAAPGSWQPDQLHLQIYNQWLTMPLSGLDGTHSSQYLGLAQPINWVPTLSAGFSWN